MGSSLKLDKSQVHFTVKYGTERLLQKKMTGRWPGGSQNSLYESLPFSMKMNSSRNILSGFISTEENLFLKEIKMTFKIRSRQNNTLQFCGTYSGSPGLTVSDDHDLIRLKRNKTMSQFICFKTEPYLHQVSIIWHFNCFLAKDKTLPLDPVLITEEEVIPQPPVKNKTTPNLYNSPRNAWIAPESEDRCISLKSLEENLSWMEKVRFFFGMVRLDGLHPKSGDWDNLYTEYKGKIGLITRRIDHNGMIPCIGFSPFHGEAGSDLVKIHPDWFVKDLKSDSLLTIQQQQKKIHILDFTHQKVQEYLRETLELFIRQWGFKAIHIKGLSHLLIPGQHFDSSIETGALIYEALVLFRTIMGPDAFISTEEIPLVTQENQLTMMTTGTGISSRRKSKKQISDLIYKIVDHIYVSHYPWMMNIGSYPLPEDREKIHPQAGESLRQMILINGGFLTISRDLTKLTPAQEVELKKLTPAFKKFSTGSLHLLSSPGKNKPFILFNTTGYIGVFNLSAKKRKIILNMEDLKQSAYSKSGASMIREGKTRMKTTELELLLPPFGSRIFKF